MCVFPGNRKVMFILCGNYKLLFYLRNSFRYLFLFIRRILYLKQMCRRVYGLGQNVRQLEEFPPRVAGKVKLLFNKEWCVEQAGRQLCRRGCWGAWKASALWCCDIAETLGHSFHEPGGTGLLQLAGEDGDWFLAFVFLADLSIVLLRHHFLFPLDACALSLRGQPWNSLWRTGPQSQTLLHFVQDNKAVCSLS